MKKYVKPSFECVELRCEERLALVSCYGSCESWQTTAWDAPGPV